MDEVRRRHAMLVIDTGTADATARTELDTYLRDKPNDPEAVLRRRPRRSAPMRRSPGATRSLRPLFAASPCSAAGVSGDDAKAFDMATKARQAYPDDPDMPRHWAC